MSELNVKLDMSEIGSGLEAFARKVEAAVGMYSTTKAQEIRGHMQMNRPWTDRTGDAKKFLTAQVTKPGGQTMYRIVLSHGVDYGIWLELANEKNYAIVGPTLALKGPEIIKDMAGLASRLSL